MYMFECGRGRCRQDQMLLSFLSFDFIKPLLFGVTCDQYLGRKIPLYRVWAKPSPAGADLCDAMYLSGALSCLPELSPSLPQHRLPSPGYVA